MIKVTLANGGTHTFADASGYRVSDDGLLHIFTGYDNSGFGVASTTGETKKTIATFAVGWISVGIVDSEEFLPEDSGLSDDAWMNWEGENRDSLVMAIRHAVSELNSTIEILESLDFSTKTQKMASELLSTTARMLCLWRLS